MNRSLLFASLLLMSPGMIYAQNGAFEQDLDREIDQISAARTSPQTATAQNAPVGATIAPQGSANGQPIYILNQATPTSTAQVQQVQAQVQKQPQVEIVGAPLSKSRAEQIRDARQQVEVETENRIVEKLEQSRIDDEKRRASMLFGDSFQQQQQVVAPVQQQVAPVQPVVVAAPVVDNSLKEDSVRNVVREELQTAMKRPEPIIPIETRYFGAIAGIGDYPDVSNVQGNYVLGASFGNIYDNSMIVEGSFLYSDYTVADMPMYFDPYCGCTAPRLIDVRQYSGALAVKYMFLEGLIRPIVGGLVQYSYRTYGWSKDNFGYSGKSDDVTSHAIDVGVVAGADIAFNERFSLGFDFRYMWNVASRVSSQPYWFKQPQYFGTPLEKLQYYTMSLVGRVNF